jgi:HD superfamily phosphohydrolase
MSWKDPLLNHLDRDYTEPIRDPLWHNIRISAELKRITQQTAFQRLGRIKQLGPAFHVYPGATHTRLAHSFGVFHIARLFIRKFIPSPSCPRLTIGGVKAFLLAALLHDLGHFPYAHSLKELALKKHEALTAELVLREPLSDAVRGILGIDPYTPAAIVDDALPVRDGGEISFYRNILSGVLDPDKLDYLNRDAYFCGVPYGIQDIDFIISKIDPHPKQGVALSEQGVSAVENLLFSKYLMYKTVYWHKTVRIATAMIKKAVFSALAERHIRNEDLYGIDDEEFTRMFGQLPAELKSLTEGVTNRSLYKVLTETDFDEGNPKHRGLTGLESRHEMEKQLAERISGITGGRIAETHVIIDVPEPISFEVNLPILKQGSEVSFAASGSVFNPPVVQGFTSSLRKIRCIVPERLVSALPPDDIRAFFSTHGLQ